MHHSRLLVKNWKRRAGEGKAHLGVAVVFNGKGICVRFIHEEIFQNMTLKEKLKEYFSIFCLRKTHEMSFKRSNFLKLLMYFQNNKYSLNCIIVVFL